MNNDLEKLKLENDELNEKLEAKRNAIKSLCEELDGLRIISIENQRLTIENKHLKEDRPQSELDAAHLAAENAMLNTNLARYISATQNTEKELAKLQEWANQIRDDLEEARSERDANWEKVGNLVDLLIESLKYLDNHNIEAEGGAELVHKIKMAVIQDRGLWE